MCLALPARVLELQPGAEGVVELNGVRKRVSFTLVPDAVPGDYVIVHVGYAIGKIDPVEAERTLRMFAEIDQASMQSLAPVSKETAPT